MEQELIVLVAVRREDGVDADVRIGGGLGAGPPSSRSRSHVELLVPGSVGQHGAEIEPAEDRGEHADPGQRERGPDEDALELVVTVTVLIRDHTSLVDEQTYSPDLGPKGVTRIPKKSSPPKSTNQHAT